MGNSPSVEEKPSASSQFDDIWWTNGDQIKTSQMEETTDFAENFEQNREKRKQILADKKREIQGIREELAALKKENNQLRGMDLNTTLQKNSELEMENVKLKEEIKLLKEKNGTKVSELEAEINLLKESTIEFENQREEYNKHVAALKDVIKVSKQLLQIRENQLTVLKQKIADIEATFAEKETVLMSSHLRKEYERQLTNIQTLRDLYESRDRANKKENSELRATIEAKDKEIENATKKQDELHQRIQELENDNSKKYDEIMSLESNLGLTKAECRQYQSELTVINHLFSNILLEFNNSQEYDWEKLMKQLEDHHDLLQNIATKEFSIESSSALPKILLNLVNEASGDAENKEKETQVDSNDEATVNNSNNINSPSEIVKNLPKVWKVLIELLSHHCNSPDLESDLEKDKYSCFKTVETPKGPNLVLSVSRTFIRLKDLITEKKTLEKDMNHLKKLNTHLESRLQDQETRFLFVSNELTKTWKFVEKLEKEHRLLHTQEQILRYELSQKRKLLKHLREELEYSREKWKQAREKNSKTEKEWQELRLEFASRKKITKDESNSIESGYSDEKEESSDDDAEYKSYSMSKNNEIESEAEETADLLDSVPGNITANNDEINCNLGSIIDADTSIQSNTSLETSTCEADSNKSCDFTVTTETSQLENIAEDSSNLQSSSKETIDIHNISCESVKSSFPSPGTSSGAIKKTPTLDRLTFKEKLVPTNDSPRFIVPETNSKHEKIEHSSDILTTDSKISSDKVSTVDRLTFEEKLAAKDARLTRLEGECRELYSKVTNTSNRSLTIVTKLDDLHEIYGESSRNNQNSTSATSIEDTDEGTLFGDDVISDEPSDK